MRATARARTRRDEETLEVLPERDGAPSRRNGRRGARRSPTTGDEDADASGKPLGWLFRSSS